MILKIREREYDVNDKYIIIEPIEKFFEIIEYLNKDDGFWLQDKWEIESEVFKNYGINFNKSKVKYTTKSGENKICISNYRNYFDFTYIENENLKLELKYWFTYNLREKEMKATKLLNSYYAATKYLINFIIEKYENINSFKDIEIKKVIWVDYLKKNGVNTKDPYYSLYNTIPIFFSYYYDTREETEKDIWYAKNIPGVKIPANGVAKFKNPRINFTDIPKYYRELIKRYLKTRITLFSFINSFHNKTIYAYFFNFFYGNGYSDGFFEELKRIDFEKFIYSVHQLKLCQDEKHKRIRWIINFIKTIQEYEYEQAPRESYHKLFYYNDAPPKMSVSETAKNSIPIPEPIIQQLDGCIDELALPEYNRMCDRKRWINFYKMLRYTGWRGTDVLDIRYDNCLEKAWNKKENYYEYYLCGYASKTDNQLRIPLLDEDPYLGWKMVDIVEKCINEAKEKSTKESNLKKYLFNNYEGKHKDNPWSLQPLNGQKSSAIEMLIKTNQIKDEFNKELYHFRRHRLRNTRISELIDVYELGIEQAQAWVGHCSLQMTLHYHQVKHNKIYEKMKQVKTREVYKVDVNSHEVIELDAKEKEELIKWHLVRKGLDSVKVPFGICFKPEKMLCKQQTNHCFSCGSFCVTVENIPEYKEEIIKVKDQITRSKELGRGVWTEKNELYLKTLEEILKKIKGQNIVHKNSRTREVI
jgi:hypothetical protein